MPKVLVTDNANDFERKQNLRDQVAPDLPFVSIIVPCRNISKYELECLKHCLDLDYPDFEVLFLTDQSQGNVSADPRVRFIETGKVKPSAKRNLGTTGSRGPIVAFLDSDAYPDPKWLIHGVSALLRNESIGMVGGPNLTPSGDGFYERAGGFVLSSYLGTGSLAHRYGRKTSHEVDDLPTCNIITRRSVLEKLGGFDVNYWPGEDTYLCLQVQKQLGLGLLYLPEVVVYHHRRPLFRPHLRQIWGYGLHRGYFAKRYPENSRKMRYFAPSILVIALIAGSPLSLLASELGPIYLTGVGSYALACLIEGAKSRSIRMTFYVAVGIAMTHLTYGLAFLKGLLSSRLKEDASGKEK